MDMNDEIIGDLRKFASDLVPWKPQSGWGLKPSVSFPSEIVNKRITMDEGVFSPTVVSIMKKLVRLYKTLILLSVDFDLMEEDVKEDVITCIGITVRIFKRLIYPFFLDSGRNLMKVTTKLDDALSALKIITRQHDITFESAELNTQYIDLLFSTLKLTQKHGVTLVIDRAFSGKLDSFLKSARRLLTQVDAKHTGVLGFAHMFPETMAPISALEDRLEGWLRYWSGRMIPVSIVDFMVLINKTMLMYVGTRALLQRIDEIADCGKDIMERTDRVEIYDKLRPQKLGRALIFMSPGCDACTKLLESEFWSKWIGSIPATEPMTVQVNSKQGLRLNDMCFIEFIPSVMYDLTYLHSIDVSALGTWKGYRRMELMTKDYPFRPIDYRGGEDEAQRQLLVDKHLKRRVGKRAVADLIRKLHNGGRISVEVKEVKPRPGRKGVRNILGGNQLEKKL